MAAAHVAVAVDGDACCWLSWRCVPPRAAQRSSKLLLSLHICVTHVADSTITSAIHLRDVLLLLLLLPLLPPLWRCLLLPVLLRWLLPLLLPTTRVVLPWLRVPLVAWVSSREAWEAARGVAWHAAWPWPCCQTRSSWWPVAWWLAWVAWQCHGWVVATIWRVARLAWVAVGVWAWRVAAAIGVLVLLLGLWRWSAWLLLGDLLRDLAAAGSFAGDGLQCVAVRGLLPRLCLLLCAGPLAAQCAIGELWRGCGQP
jgi:hypothetical protein